MSTSTRKSTSYLPGLIVYAYVRRRTDNKVWFPAGGVYETFGTSARTTANYKVMDLPEEGTGSGDYSGNFPTTISAVGFYDVHIRVQADPEGDPANGDMKLGVLLHDIEDTVAIAAAAAAAAAAAVEGTDAAGLLVAVNNAILALIQGGASAIASADGRSFTYNQLPDLRKMRTELQKEIAIAAGGKGFKIQHFKTASAR